ncbi:MAG: pyridoxamine 5-phosphate oxidase, partial [Actinobacteria bacterium]|nr:pyridoxamine 5-phosphate oxidase [Actinomycetota bacterium]
MIRVPLASSGLEEDDIDAVIATLRSNSLTMGVRVREFETAMAQYLGAGHFVMVNSGSSANLAIIEALL